MSEITKIQSFLDSMGYSDKRCDCLGSAKGHNPFITLSRETGAGGHTVAQAIIEQMNASNDPIFKDWHICDQEICEKVTEEPGINTTLERLISKEYHSQISDMVHELMLGHSSQDVVVKKMFDIIVALATVGKVIIIGRGASFLTKHLQLGVHVRLIASQDTRIRRMMEQKNLNEEEAKKFVLSQDKGRTNLIKTFFGKDIKDPLQYDVTWNTNHVPADEIARGILDMVKTRACHCQKVSGLAKG